MCMWVWTGICDYRYPQRSEALDLLEMKLQAVGSHPTELKIDLGVFCKSTMCS